MKSRLASHVRPETHEEGQRINQPERYKYINKHDDNSQNALNDKIILTLLNFIRLLQHDTQYSSDVQFSKIMYND